jgi:hypothetical protein
MTRSEGNRLWTEGPWSDVPNGEIDGSTFCSLAEGLSVFADNEADIPLIAAAPRLYETLDVLLDCLDREAVARLGIEQEVLAAVCALQQARGETND